MEKSRIALKPYLDNIQRYCNSCSKAELTGIIMRLAKGVSTSERVEFLEKIESCLPAVESHPIHDAGAVEQILNDIQALKESIEERIASIEDGSFWDNQNNWENDDYDDEDPDYVGEEQFDELASFFEEAGGLFLQDHLEGARKVYKALFELSGTLEETTEVFMGDDIDMREERARYCRCVYETSKKGKRLDAFAGAMEIDVADLSDPDDYAEKYPLLQDVMDTRYGEMADLDEFRVAWKKTLTRKGLGARPAVLLLETVYCLEGFGGVSKLARKWKNSQPQGYLFWLDMLKKENDLKSIVKVSTESFKALEKGRARERVAQFLINAAEDTGDAKNLLLGKRERLFSRSSDQNLLELVEEAVKQDVRKRELEKVIRFFSANISENPDETALHIKTFLMAGKLEDAFVLVEKEKSVGWSYSNNAGVVFGAILSVLADHSEKATTIRTVLRDYACITSIYSERIAIDNVPGSSFDEEILKGLKRAKHTQAQKKKYWSWALKIGKSRIDHIVSSKHRNAYKRAAQVLSCLAETDVAMGREDSARKIIHHFYFEKYIRFSAFRREVKAVVSGSGLLRTVAF